MPLSDLPMSVLFLLFLLLFLLIGLYPAWRRTAVKIRRLFRGGGLGRGLEVDDFEADQEILPDGQTSYAPMSDFEVMVLRRIAQDAGRGVTRKQIDADLFLGKETVMEALRALMRRGLVDIVVSPLFSIKFYLSEQGRRYAIENEFIANIHGSYDGS